MAQAGIHGLVGTAVRRWTPEKPLLMLGIVLGNLFPDLDNFAVAIATLTGNTTDGLHRTFTHSFFTVLGLWLLFLVVGVISKQAQWQHFGSGFAMGMIMHILLDIFIWFGHVQLFWPFAYDLNIWQHVTPPSWWMQLMMPAEFFSFALFFWVLAIMAQKQKTNLDSVRTVRIWTAVQMALFILFTILVYIMKQGFMTIYGAAYLLSLILAWIIAIKLRQTIEWRKPATKHTLQTQD